MLRLLAVPLAVVALQPFASSVRPVGPELRGNLEGRFWRVGCPVGISELRLLTVSHWGFDGHVHTGQLVVNERATAPLAKVFKRLYELRFPIRHMRLGQMYGPRYAHPADGDVTGSFHCRESVPSPCVGGTRSGRWSNHAYGLAVDRNPVENPYVGCGRTRDPASEPYLDRSRLRKGMVTAAVVRAFRSIGWGWGGDWTSGTKDYMHFSHNGR
jgi:hypothetical protein